MADQKPVKWAVRISMLGKTPVEAEAETAEEAVKVIVAGLAKRVGEPPHMHARRLDRVAEVKGPNGTVPVIIPELFPVPTLEEDEIAKGIADAIRTESDDGPS